MHEGDLGLVDMSHAGLEWPENGLWSVVLTSIEVNNESWSSLGVPTVSMFLGWAKRTQKPYGEVSFPGQPVYHIYHSSQQAVMTSKGLQLFTDGYLPVMPEIEVGRDKKYQVGLYLQRLMGQGFPILSQNVC